MPSEEMKGTLHFSMNYDQIAGILTVRLIEVCVCLLKDLKILLPHFFSQAHDLQPRDFSGTADPYAKIRLLPDASKTNMWQTRIHKRTLNPGKYFVFALI
jgi:hypothetical protein